MSKQEQAQVPSFVPMVPMNQMGQPMMYMPPVVPQEQGLPSSDVEQGEPAPAGPVLNEDLINRHSRAVGFLILLQFITAVMALFHGAFLLFLGNVVFGILGLTGLKKRNRSLLLAHFVYSLLILFLLIVCTVLLVFYCHQCNIFSLIFLGVCIMLNTILLRKQRILLQNLPSPAQLRELKRQQAEQQQQAAEQVQMPPLQIPIPLFAQPMGKAGENQMVGMYPMLPQQGGPMIRPIFFPAPMPQQ